MSICNQSSSLAQRERAGLVDLCSGLGPEAPTLDEGWTTRDLLVHLRIRESYPLAALGIFFSPFRKRTLEAEKSLSHWNYAKLLDSVLLGPPWWSILRLLDSLINTVEMFVHHEDVIRANEPTTEPRVFTPSDRETLWKHARPLVSAVLRKSSVHLVLRPTDGEAPCDCGNPEGAVVTISGPVTELVLWGYGRSPVFVEFEGDPSDVAVARGLDRHV